jgi:hypothetical protein
MNFPGGLISKHTARPLYNHALALNWFLILSAELALYLSPLRGLQKSVLPQYSKAKHSGKTVGMVPETV